MRKHTVGCHADGDALVEPTLLTLVPRVLVYHTLSTPLAVVLQVLLDCSSEESLQKEVD